MMGKYVTVCLSNIQQIKLMIPTTKAVVTTVEAPFSYKFIYFSHTAVYHLNKFNDDRVH